MSTLVQPSGRPFRPVADYGAIGDGRSVALIASDGGLDWWCPGRFDAPSTFARILDRQKGGAFGLGPALPASSRMRYVDDTNVLLTTHEVGHARVSVTDFLVPTEVSRSRESILVRRVAGLQGVVEMAVDFAPAFHYGRVPPRFSADANGLMARGRGQVMLLSGVSDFTTHPGSRRARFLVEEGTRVDLVLRHVVGEDPSPFARRLARSVDEMEAETLARWRRWSARLRVSGRYAGPVKRAALAIKLLQHEPSGAFVAAATTSLPEEVGGERNWDYRFTWLRDGAWSANVLANLGIEEDAQRFREWTQRALGPDGETLRVLYTLEGTSDAPEIELSHLEGYRQSRPVRVGNGAIDQHQLDVYGETLDFLLRDAPRQADEAWTQVLGLTEQVLSMWREPDNGIWEMRSKPQHFVFSKAMAWRALTAAAETARKEGLPGDVDKWEAEASRIRAEVLEHGFDKEKDAFVQAYGTKALDASNLLLGLMGFVDLDDPRMRGTVEATLRELTVNDLVYRYRGVDDGLSGHEATFAYCTFWLIEVMARQGRRDEARAMFERMLAHATPLGLYAEEIDARTGAHLGNFPQAFPHIGLIHAALALEEGPDAGPEAAGRSTPAD